MIPGPASSGAIYNSMWIRFPSRRIVTHLIMVKWPLISNSHHCLDHDGTRSQAKLFGRARWRVTPRELRAGSGLQGSGEAEAPSPDAPGLAEENSQNGGLSARRV